MKGYIMDCYMVSIDASTKKSGVAVFKNGNLEKSFVINFEKEKNITNRLPLMASALLKTLEDISPSIVYIEDTYAKNNISTQQFLMRLQGVVFGWCLKNDCEFNTVLPSTWRKKLNFKQGKNVKREELKQKAVDFVKEKYKKDVLDDEAEAICIGLYAIKRFTDI